MALIQSVFSELQGLLEPVAGESPCGVELEGSLELSALESASREPEEAVVGGVERVDTRNWREINSQAQALLGKSKDLRVAAHLTQSLLKLEGLPGFCAGLCFLGELAERFWPELYPALDPDDGDATMRINAIRELVDGPCLGQLRVARIFAADGLGQVTVNDLLLATASPLARADLSQAPSHIVFSVLDALGAEVVEEYVQLIEDTREQLAALITFVHERTGVYLQLGALTASQNGPLGLLDAAGQALAAEHARLSQGTSSLAAAQPADAGSSNHRNLADISRREDIIMLIERMCAYYARVEPSSPVPLLLQRAKRLATMDFVDIVRDLADQGLPQVGNVAGIRIE